MRRLNTGRREKIQPVAVPLDMLPERCTMTIHPEISARGSLIPAGDGSKLHSETFPPGTGQRGREKSAPKPYETDPFPTVAQFHHTNLTKISTDIHLRMWSLCLPYGTF